MSFRPEGLDWMGGGGQCVLAVLFIYFCLGILEVLNSLYASISCV